MGNCIIFCAAGFDSLAVPIAEEDFVIAADGGLAHTEKLGIVPDVVLGDTRTSIFDADAGMYYFLRCRV